MSRLDPIHRQVDTLLKVSNILKEEFNIFRGAVQFFRHKNKPELFVFQLREAHIADVGRSLMHLSFLVKMDYAVFDSMAFREKLNAPPQGYPPSQQYNYALKHVFLNFKLDPWLQDYIFSREATGPSPFQDVVRLPHVLQDYESHLPPSLPALETTPPLEAVSG